MAVKIWKLLFFVFIRPMYIYVVMQKFIQKCFNLHYFVHFMNMIWFYVIA